jgi:hypothetical protein
MEWPFSFQITEGVTDGKTAIATSGQDLLKIAFWGSGKIEGGGGGGKPVPLGDEGINGGFKRLGGASKLRKIFVKSLT